MAEYRKLVVFLKHSPKLFDNKLCRLLSKAVGLNADCYLDQRKFTDLAHYQAVLKALYGSSAMPEFILRNLHREGEFGDEYLLYIYHPKTEIAIRFELIRESHEIYPRFERPIILVSDISITRSS